VVAYRLDALPIAAYVQQLRIGTAAVPYLVDDAGRLVTSPDTAEVGNPASPAIRSTLRSARTDSVVQSPGARPQVIATAAVGMPGWHLVIVQPAPEFYGALWHANTSFRWLFLGFLIIVAAAILVLHAKRQAALHAIAEMAVRDSLTGLPNRVAFTRTLTRAMERHRREGSELALLFCDLDGFKAVNDQLGHAVGDLLLVASAQRLSAVAESATGVTTTLARLGGDEFTVLVEGRAVEEKAQALAESLTDAIGEPFILRGDEVRVGASIGVAFARPDRDLLRDADLAMYRMKAVRKAGRAATSPDRFAAGSSDNLRAV
jgi:diguanylate cyclase (GGDEF)-like protein